MEKKLYYTANEVSEILGISVSHAYKVIREANEELKDILSELAGLVVNILIARFMTYATEQHKRKERLYGSIQG